MHRTAPPYACHRQNYELYLCEFWKCVGRRGLATLLGMVMASLEELVIERCHDLLTPGAFQAMGACRGLKARLCEALSAALPPN